MGSNCTKSPGCLTWGRGGDTCRLRCQRFLRRLCLSNVRFTDESETTAPSSLSAKWTTSADRLSSNRFAMIFRTSASGSTRGCRFGLDENVGIGRMPYRSMYLTHPITAVWWYPRYLPTFRALHPG